MINSKEICSILKQKVPFVFVDRVLEMQEGKRIVAIKNVTANEGFMAQHFPNNPVFPGVLIIETVAQTVSVLCSLSQEIMPVDEDSFLALGGVQRFNLVKPVRPGDTMRIEVDIIKVVPTAAIVKAVVKVDENIVADGQLTFGVVKGE